MPDDVSPACLGIGQNGRCTTRGSGHQPRICALGGPAPIKGEQQRNQIVHRHDDRARPPPGRTPIGHERHIRPASNTCSWKCHLFKPKLCQIHVDPIEGCCHVNHLPALRQWTPTRIGPGANQDELVRATRMWQRLSQRSQILSASSSHLFPEPTIDDNSHMIPGENSRSETICQPIRNIRSALLRSSHDHTVCRGG